MLNVLLPLLLSSASLASEVPPDGAYALPDSGFTLKAPGWHMSRWSDFDFKGRSADGGVFLQAWSTSFQLTLTDAEASDLTRAWQSKLEDEERAENISVVRMGVEEVAGRRTVRAELSFSLPGGGKGVMHGAAFATNGLTAQLATLAAGPNAGRAAKAMDQLLAEIAVTAPPAELTTTGALVHGGVTLTLTGGFRPPLASEKDYVLPLTTRTGAREPGSCASAIRPRGNGDPDLLLLCHNETPPVLVDSASFPSEAPLFAQQLFGKASEKLAPAEQVSRGDLLGILIHARGGLWAGGVTTATGHAVVWVVGETAVDDDLGQVARTAVAELKLDEDATYSPALGALFMHRLAHQKTHPMVLVPALLVALAVGFLARLIFKSSPPDPELPTM